MPESVVPPLHYLPAQPHSAYTLFFGRLRIAMCCGSFHRCLEFTILLLSSWAAGIVASTIFEVASLSIRGQTIESRYAEGTDSEYEIYFASYRFVAALVFTGIFTVSMNSLSSMSCSCAHHEDQSGRKERILRGGMSIKLVSMVWNPVQIYYIENVELKNGMQLYMGVWLYVFEFASTLIDLSLISREKEFIGRWRVCVKIFADFMCAQMIAAQLFNVNEWQMWASSVVASLVAMIFLYIKYATDSIEYETGIVWTGLGVGFVEGLAFSKAQFKTQEEVIGYSILFILSMILPIITKEYEAVELPEEVFSHIDLRRRESGVPFDPFDPFDPIDDECMVGPGRPTLQHHNTL